MLNRTQGKREEFFALALPSERLQARQARISRISGSVFPFHQTLPDHSGGLVRQFYQKYIKGVIFEALLE